MPAWTPPAIFAHVAARLRDTADSFGGSVVLLFDVDEHTGSSGGAKAYFEHAGPVDGVMIGYPGLDDVVTGAGAITKAAYLIGKLNQLPLPGPPGPEFPLPAKLTVTAISGGEGYSMVPDLCTVNVDVRLTPALMTGPPSRCCRRRQLARTRRGRAPRRPMSKSPPGGRHTPCQTVRRCATHC
jgi:acetylornithine deacetylase/succinyl-diaminopimelate desuccinylase-like protein